MKQFIHSFSFFIIFILVVFLIIKTGYFWMGPVITILCIICLSTRGHEKGSHKDRLDVKQEDLKKILDTY
jgi:hypothetical protein